MRPVPLPNDLELKPGERTAVFSAPDGDLLNPYVQPVEVVVAMEAGVTWFEVMVALEDGDLELLQQGAPIWLSFRGGVPVFAVEVSKPA